MRIATWNIQMASAHRARRVAAAVEALDADVVVLTEFLASDDTLSRALRRAGYAILHSRPVPPLLGVAVAARGPTRLNESDPCPPWAGVCAVLHAGVRIVGVYAPRSTDHVGGRRQVQRDWWDGLIGRCDRWRREPTAILGDFDNGLDGVHADRAGAFPHGDRFAALARHGFRDGFAEGRASDHPEPVWSWWQQHGPRCVDHLVVSDALRVQEARYVTHAGAFVLTDSAPHPDRRNRLSDRAALVADVEVSDVEVADVEVRGDDMPGR